MSKCTKQQKATRWKTKVLGSKQNLSLWMRSKPNHRKPGCRNKNFWFALLQQRHPGQEHTGQKQCFLLNLSPQKCITALKSEALTCFHLISKIFLNNEIIQSQSSDQSNPSYNGYRASEKRMKWDLNGNSVHDWGNARFPSWSSGPRLRKLQRITQGK